MVSRGRTGVAVVVAAAILVGAPGASADTGTTITEVTAPAIIGNAQQGDALSTSFGAYETPAGVPLTSFTATFAWEDCDQAGSNCAAIAGATDPAYTVAATDVGDTIRSEVWIDTTDGPFASAPTAVVLAMGVPTVITPPAIQAGNPLTVIPATWNGNPNGFSYQWLDCALSSGNFIDPGPLPISWLDPSCTPIPGATGLTYSPSTSDSGYAIAVEEWATNGFGTGLPAQSSAAPTTYAGAGVPPATVTPPPPATAALVAPANSGLPSITGNAIVESTLTATPGSWVGSAPMTYAYQWQRCSPSCVDVAGATGSSYTLTSADLGNMIQVIVVASNSAGNANATSSRIGPITAFADASVPLFERALARAITPPSRTTIKWILRGRGYEASVSALPAGKLTLTWAMRDRGKLVALASGSGAVGQSGAATIRIVLSRGARARLRGARRAQVRAVASLAPTGGAVMEVAASFTLRS